jgi:hypothetical protein
MGETSYRKAWERLSDAQRKDFDDRLTAWKAAAPQIVENFEREHFLPDAEMMELMKFIIREGIPVGDTIITKLQEELIYTKLQLKGGEIRVSPKRIGFVIPEIEYKKFLYKTYYAPNSPDKKEMENFLTKLLLGVKENKENLDFLIKDGRCLHWVTWDKNKGEDPFLWKSDDTTCQDVQIALGLDKKRYAHSKLLLFCVDVAKLKNKGIQLLFRPTFCDAGFGENFRPAPMGFEDHGFTWPFGKQPYSETDHRKKGQPEAVARSEYITLNVIDEIIPLDK